MKKFEAEEIWSWKFEVENGSWNMEVEIWICCWNLKLKYEVENGSWYLKLERIRWKWVIKFGAKEMLCYLKLQFKIEFEI